MIVAPRTEDEIDIKRRRNFFTEISNEVNTLSSRISKELSADPDDPDEGEYVIWMSDGTGTGDDGDIVIKITAGGVTKTKIIVDYSAI